MSIGRRITAGDLRAWYGKFDPVGSMGNVYLLLPRHTEWQATVELRKFASVMGQSLATLKAVPKDKR